MKKQYRTDVIYFARHDLVNQPHKVSEKLNSMIQKGEKIISMVQVDEIAGDPNSFNHQGTGSPHSFDQAVGWARMNGKLCFLVTIECNIVFEDVADDIVRALGLTQSVCSEEMKADWKNRVLNILKHEVGR